MADDSERVVIAAEVVEECSTSTSEKFCEEEQSSKAIQTSDQRALQKMQKALKSKIMELEEVEAEEKDTLKQTKKAVREVQRILNNKELSMDTKIEHFQQKYLQQVSEQVKVEKSLAVTQRKLDNVSSEKTALSDELRRMSLMNTKLQELCRTLQQQNKTVVQEAQDRAAVEAKQREELSQRLEASMKEISSKLEDHSAESQKCIAENIELRCKIKDLSKFCDEMDQTHKAQLSRKDVQINFLQERLKEQSELVAHYERAEKLLQEKCKASEEARDSYATQLEHAKDKISGFCSSFEKSNKAFKQLQSQMDMSNKLQKKMQHEADLLRTRSDLMQSKSDKVVSENEKLSEQVDNMRAKLEESVPSSEHAKLESQKEALEGLCRALQSELNKLRLKVDPKDDTISHT